jgi:2-methylisocitrate lyase-like PEP mutase family enzyme
MQTQAELADQFRALHAGHAPLILPNVWDPLSAAIVAGAGLPGVATASAAVALSRGFDDGELVPFDDLTELVRRISAVINVPISVDFERGYGKTPEIVRENTLELIVAGAVGVNIEDSLDHENLRGVEQQCERIAAVRDAGTEAGVAIFINVRTDVFMIKQGPETEDEAISRLTSYCDAGADGVYPILCNDLAILRHIHATTDKPINVLLRPATPPVAALMEVGVRRISLGPGLLSIAAAAIADAVRGLASGDLDLNHLPQLTTTDMRRLQGIETN